VHKNLSKDKSPVLQCSGELKTMFAFSQISTSDSRLRVHFAVIFKNNSKIMSSLLPFIGV